MAYFAMVLCVTAFVFGRIVVTYERRKNESLWVDKVLPSYPLVVALSAFIRAFAGLLGSPPTDTSANQILSVNLLTTTSLALIGSLLPLLTEALDNRLHSWWAAWVKGRDARRHYRRKRREARQERRAQRRRAKQQRRQSDPNRLIALARAGYDRIWNVARSNQEFWASLNAYVYVLVNPDYPSAEEVSRLGEWLKDIDYDLRRLAKTPQNVDIATFPGNKEEMRRRLQERRSQGLKLLQLAVAMLCDTDDDMLDIERDISTARTYAEERRDTLIADYRTLLDQIELLIGAAPLPQANELIRRADEEVAMLTSGDLRAVQAYEEVDDLLKRNGLAPLLDGGLPEEEARLRAVKAHLARGQRS